MARKIGELELEFEFKIPTWNSNWDFQGFTADFSIGFGQEIFGWNDKSGTRWKICWIPLGGYVKFFGDRNVFSQAVFFFVAHPVLVSFRF